MVSPKFSILRPIRTKMPLSLAKTLYVTKINDLAIDRFQLER